MNHNIETPEDFADIQRECIKRVRHYVDVARDVLHVKIEYPRVVFNIKGTTAGSANFHKNLIRFSPVMLRENPEHFLKQTTGHEVAHLIARAQFGATIDPHGTEWTRVMYAFRLPAVRCHSYDTQNVSTRIGKVRKAKSSYEVKTNDGIVRFLPNAKIIELD